MVDWWIMDGDIREKFFEVYVPRFREKEGSISCFYFLKDIEIQEKFTILNKKQVQ